MCVWMYCGASCPVSNFFRSVAINTWSEAIIDLQSGSPKPKLRPPSLHELLLVKNNSNTRSFNASGIPVSLSTTKIVAFCFHVFALKHISSKITGMVQCLYPVATAGIAYFVLDERLSPPGMIGAAIIIIAVLLESAGN